MYIDLKYTQWDFFCDNNNVDSRPIICAFPFQDINNNQHHTKRFTFRMQVQSAFKMQDNIVTMPMHVKLQIPEREFAGLNVWTPFLVQVEAIKCFPSYAKISFFKTHTDDTTELVVCINIPGLTVKRTTSRTHPHAYGLFWRNNRRRCCAFFALPSELLCEYHIQWMRKSIRELESFRLGIIQKRSPSASSGVPTHEMHRASFAARAYGKLRQTGINYHKLVGTS